MLKVNANNYRFLLEQTDASNIAGTIKLFFRELKTPLLPLKYIEEVIIDEKAFLSKHIESRMLTLTFNVPLNVLQQKFYRSKYYM